MLLSLSLKCFKKNSNKTKFKENKSFLSNNTKKDKSNREKFIQFLKKMNQFINNLRINRIYSKS